MNTAHQADWDAYVDRRIRKVLQDLNVRMAKSLGAAVNQSLSREREGIKAELVVRDARIVTMEKEFGAAVVQLLAREREVMKAELAVRDARIAALEAGLARAQDAVAAIPKPNGSAVGPECASAASGETSGARLEASP